MFTDMIDNSFLERQTEIQHQTESQTEKMHTYWGWSYLTLFTPGYFFRQKMQILNRVGGPQFFVLKIKKIHHIHKIKVVYLIWFT